MRKYQVITKESGKEVVIATFRGQYAQLDAMRFAERRGIPQTFVKSNGYTPTVQRQYGD